MTTSSHIVTAAVDWTNLNPEGTEPEFFVKVLGSSVSFTLSELEALGIRPPAPDPQVGDLVQVQPPSKARGVVTKELAGGYYEVDFGYVTSSTHKEEMTVIGKVV